MFIFQVSVWCYVRSPIFYQTNAANLSLNLSYVVTIAGYKCFVNPNFGSYFIRCLCKALREQHTMSELHAIAVKVNNMVARVTTRPREGGGKNLSLFCVTNPAASFFKEQFCVSHS